MLEQWEPVIGLEIHVQLATRSKLFSAAPTAFGAAPNSQVAWLANQNMNYLISERVPKRMGNAHANLVPYQVFQCADGDVVVAAGNDNLFRGLCRGLERADLAADPRFRANPDRVRNREALISILQGIFAARPAAEWVGRLREQSVPVAPINDLSQVFEDPQVVSRAMKVTVEHPAAGSVPLVANPIRLSETPITYDAPPPMLGEHTGAVLAGLLGLSERQIAELAAQNIVQVSN